MRRAWVTAVIVVLALPASASATDPPPAPLGVPALGGFRSVLAQGEGQQLNALQFGQYQLTGQPPATYTNPMRRSAFSRVRYARTLTTTN